MGTSKQTFVMWDEEARDQFVRHLVSLGLDPSRPRVVELREYEEAPTDEQRGYYHAVVLPTLCAWSGYRRHEMDAFLHQEFGPKADMEVGGRRRTVAVFSMGSKGSKRAASVFLDMVLQWAAELGVYIPPARSDA